MQEIINDMYQNDQGRSITRSIPNISVIKVDQSIEENGKSQKTQQKRENNPYSVFSTPNSVEIEEEIYI